VYLYIIPLHFSDQTLLRSLSSTLKELFKLEVIILENSFSLEPAKEPLRSQYNSTWILSQLLNLVPDESSKILGITSLDLYIPVLTFVFGEAQLEGKSAIISGYRLRDELYGLPRNFQKLKDRLEKEAVHELGHTFGLIHCREPQCVMHPCTYAEEIDFKSVNFCKKCLAFLEEKRKK
jgi:archaemetzincin